MTRTLYIERVLTELAHGAAPRAREVTAALEELRRIQMEDVRREAVEQHKRMGWTTAPQ